MTSTSRDTRQPARSRTQVRLRVNFGGLGSYGAPRRPRWRRPPTRVGDGFRRRTVRVGPLRSRDGLGSTSWPSPIGPTSNVAVDVGMTAESWALRPAARGSHRGMSGLPSNTSTTRPLTWTNEGQRPGCVSDGARPGPAVGERVCPLFLRASKWQPTAVRSRVCAGRRGPSGAKLGVLMTASSRRSVAGTGPECYGRGCLRWRRTVAPSHWLARRASSTDSRFSATGWPRASSALRTRY
jgi:hypothetical protein